MGFFMHSAFVALLTALAVVSPSRASAQSTEFISESAVANLYSWERGDIKRPIARSSDGGIAQSSSFSTRITFVDENNVQMDDLCFSHNGRMKAPHNFKRVLPFSLADYLFLHFYDIASPNLNPVFRAPQVVALMDSATAVFVSEQATDIFESYLFFTDNRIVCMAYGPEFPAFATWNFIVLVGKENAQNSPVDFFNKIICPNSTASQCSSNGQSPPPKPTPEPNPKVDPVGTNGGGSGAVLQEELSNEAKITALLNGGASRTAEIELLLCAGEHPACIISSLAPADIRLFLQLADKTAAELKTIEQLSV